MLEKIKEYIKEVKGELKKVTFPSRDETITSTVVLIIVIFAISIFLATIDSGLNKLLGLVFK